MGKRVVRYVGVLALAAASFAVFHWVYGYVIVLQGGTSGCFFMFDRQFFGEFLEHPGGLLTYAGRFLAQFYHYPWLGALLAAGCLTGFGVLFRGILTRVRATVAVWQTLLPYMLVLALHASLAYFVYGTLGLAASCGGFLGYLLVRGKVLRRGYALAATPILYLALGVYAWLFVAWVAVFEWRDSPSRSGGPFTIAYVVLSVALPLVAWRWVFAIPLSSALLYPSTFVIPYPSIVVSPATGHVDVALTIACAALLVVIPFCGWPSAGTDPAAARPARRRMWRRVAPGIGLVGLAAVLHVIRYDSEHDAMAVRRQLYARGQWEALLAEAKRSPSGHVVAQFMTNRALCKTGRLLDEMFTYPQLRGPRGAVFTPSGTQIGSDDDTRWAMYNSDLFFDLGHVDFAMRHAYNYICTFGMTYESLQRMAMCAMVNGHYSMAAKYLTLLERTLFHSGPARRYKAIIADPGAAEREFGDLRRNLATVNGPVLAVPIVTLLGTGTDNRMALEYRTAWRLLERSKNSIVAIARNIDDFRRAGFRTLPVHCQQALLLRDREENMPTDLGGYSYSAPVEARVDKFMQDVKRHWGRPDVREQVLALHGDTYMFYAVFGAKLEDAHRRKLLESRQ